MAATPGTGIDALFSIAGALEAVVAACAQTCTGGDIQCRFWPRNEDERRIAKEKGIDLAEVHTREDLVRGDNVFFSATGNADGELVQGVHFFGDGATTRSIVMGSRSRTTRCIDATHRLSKLGQLTSVPFDELLRWRIEL